MEENHDTRKYPLYSALVIFLCQTSTANAKGGCGEERGGRSCGGGGRGFLCFGEGCSGLSQVPQLTVSPEVVVGEPDYSGLDIIVMHHYDLPHPPTHYHHNVPLPP